MTAPLDKFGLAIDTPLAASTSRVYRPPSWPPPRDWVCIEDANGNAVSRWGDPIWDLSPWLGKSLRMNFGDGPKLNRQSPTLDSKNADILRMIMTWKIWGPRGLRSANTAISICAIFRPMMQVCSAEGILASDLMRFPAVAEKVARRIPPSKFNEVVSELDALLDAKEFLNFVLFDRDGIQRLKAAQPEHTTEQTEYIPTRIWTYQVTRLRECLEDYLACQENIESCFKFCLDAYRKNWGDAIKLKARERGNHRNPFLVSRNTGTDKTGAIFYGPFSDTAEKFGISDLLVKWTGGILNSKGITALSSYLTLIQYAGLAYIINFTLMRIEEADSIRADCLEWHDDEKFGRIPLIRGETTKTDPDSDARWVASPSVEVAVRALRSVAFLRTNCANDQNNKDENPYLIGWAAEPWNTKRATPGNSHRPSVAAYGDILTRFPCLFNLEQLTITEEDFKIARAVCPTLNTDRFQVGKPWPLGWHQIRRTGAVNMFASGKISDSSIQLQMKHLTRTMSLYYGRGNSNLRFSEETRVMLVNTQYEAMGRELVAVHTDRFVSPHGDDYKQSLLTGVNGRSPISLISERDAVRYEQAARKHQISFRRTVLGACMKNGQCDGDCIESVGDCAGYVGRSPCAHVLFDRERADANKVRLDGVMAQLKITPPGSPRQRALEQERRGLENYFAYIK